VPGSVKYITPEDLVQIVDAIQSFEYVNKEEVPDYDAEQFGIDEYFSLIDRLTNDTFYPTVISKATGLFLYLNTSHYFSNGNKRLAVFSLVSFLESNGFEILELSKSEFQSIMTDIFKVEVCEDFESFSPADFFMYNFAIITAQFNKNGVDFDSAKAQVRDIIQIIFSNK
jgi:prophage maintenance system killer protein